MLMKIVVSTAILAMVHDVGVECANNTALLANVQVLVNLLNQACENAGTEPDSTMQSMSSSLLKLIVDLDLSTTLDGLLNVVVTILIGLIGDGNCDTWGSGIASCNTTATNNLTSMENTLSSDMYNDGLSILNIMIELALYGLLQLSCGLNIVLKVNVGSLLNIDGDINL